MKQLTPELTIFHVDDETPIEQFDALMKRTFKPKPNHALTSGEREYLGNMGVDYEDSDRG